VYHSKLVRYCPQARAQRGIFSIRTEEERLRRAECRVAGEVPEHHRQLRGRALELDKFTSPGALLGQVYPDVDQLVSKTFDSIW